MVPFSIWHGGEKTSFHLNLLLTLAVPENGGRKGEGGKSESPTQKESLKNGGINEDVTNCLCMPVPRPSQVCGKSSSAMYLLVEFLIPVRFLLFYHLNVFVSAPVLS